MYKKIICAMLASNILVPLAGAEEFVVPKKTKKKSQSTIQQECCQACGTLMKELSQTIEACAQLQQELLAQSRQYIEGDTKGFLSTGSKDELGVYTQHMQLLEKELARIQKGICQIKRK